ncbi:hypothetical protein [Haloactinomyces albus]|uniref:Uncharacterized protein n=1 Tax=Haloactinomyces albus TaxID=1352928 RepID=A0AAE3ZDF6_9ACTN|nr:hypothetical protein [Haloactinomyces albus]MDR7301049.1 hypothetical protein [Haloactinomyces albus]
MSYPLSASCAIADQGPVTTYEQAAGINPYDLAEWYSDIGNRPASPHRSIPEHLEELARAAALAEHLADIHGHRLHAALITGATVADIAGALGITAQRITAEWLNWVAGQRDLHDGTDGRFGISSGDYTQVSAVLAEDSAARRSRQQS